MPLYNKGKESLLDGTIVVSTADMRWMLVKSTYTYTATHEFVSDTTPGTNDNGRSAALSGKTVTDGVFDATDTSLTATAASACNALILYAYNAADAAAQLLAYYSIGAFTPSASQTINIVHDNGANRIFAL